MYSSPDSDSELPYKEPPSNEALEPIRKPPPYTGTPLFLFLSDIKLFFQDFFYLPYLFIPLYPWKSGPFCELYPSRENLIGITIHCILSATQFAFLVSLFTLSFLPTFVYIGYVGVFFAANFKNWFQKNIDRISRTLHRPVVEITLHIIVNANVRSAGVFFDLIQCLIQRALLYATQDVRECYVLVKNALLDDHKKKVILILHSQCGIEGGMIIDWLLDEMPLDKLQKLEVYTFSNLANHFSNPYRGNGTRSSVVPHIEHHVNEKDFAYRFGVLNFTRHYTQNQNRFAGKVFINRRARDATEGDFMHRKVRVRTDGTMKVTTKAELPPGFVVTGDEGVEEWDYEAG
ncbi:hypothetical protein FOC4_g10004689 [Fusarium odoratissimum]|uniref:Uncharacterized protein n=1 Tax=Fusarium oxysporum f. sp. cubense (strain race 4) TaxID=2502994 RepID=N1S3B4_FUSC4|nr:hypothetical protein FOC4_g10004689 [Fusarium odoratissimum]